VRFIFGIGLQSGGTTIVSSMWLRRPDADGVLDTPDGVWPLQSAGAAAGAFDIFHQKLCFSAGPITADRVCARVTKTSASDQVSWYLILRNPYHAVASLKTKVYGQHWPEKLAKYHQHYLQARSEAIPMISYERFVRSPTAAMAGLFADLRVPPVEVRLEDEIQAKRVYQYVPTNHTYTANPNRIVLTRPQGRLTKGEIDYICRTCNVMCQQQGWVP
jgi:hypothetical protein